MNFVSFVKGLLNFKMGAYYSNFDQKSLEIFINEEFEKQR